MAKLRKFKEKKLTNKNIMISFVTIIVLLITLVMSKSYAIYKMQKEFDVIKSQIGSFTNGDVKVAVLVDGKETNEFPSYETNYKIESVECTNGVTGSFDVENWQVTISDMKATSTKCTVSFDSSATNEITPINMSKKDLIALNESITDEFKTNLKKELLNDTYPVGSIYMSTTDDTVEKVEEKFGGTWVKYSSGTTLVGDDGTNYITNDTSKGSGGNKTVTLTTANLPSHSHVIPSLPVSTWSGSHYHKAPNNGNFVINYYGTRLGTYKYDFTTVPSGAFNPNENETASSTITVSGQKTTASNTTTCTNCSSSPINVQNPYTVVYMYKRTA